MCWYKSRVSGFKKAPRCSTAFPAMTCFTATSTFLPLRVYCQGKHTKMAFKPKRGRRPPGLVSQHIPSGRKDLSLRLSALSTGARRKGSSTKGAAALLPRRLGDWEALARACLLECKMGVTAPPRGRTVKGANTALGSASQLCFVFILSLILTLLHFVILQRLAVTLISGFL